MSPVHLVLHTCETWTVLEGHKILMQTWTQVLVFYNNPIGLQQYNQETLY